MAIGVRDYLENLGHTVGYDRLTGDVLVKNDKGTMTSIGSEGFTLNDNGRYYADDESVILSALSKNGVSPKPGYSPVRNSLSGENSISYNEKTGQLYVNGRDYNVDGQNLVNIGGVIYGKNDFIDSLEKGAYENEYEGIENATLSKLLNSEYGGYNPEKDESYKAAYNSFITDAKADMGERGIISDSLSTHYAAQGAEKLMPAFAELDFERYKYGNEKLKDALDIMGKFDENSQNAYKINGDMRQREMEIMHGRDSDKADEIYRDGEEGRDGRLLDKEHENKEALLDKEYQHEDVAAERDFNYEKELLRLQNDLGISRDQAQAYIKMIYGVR